MLIKSTELAPRRSYHAGGRGGCLVSADASQPEPTGAPEGSLTPGEALMKLFLDNADNGRNAANDEFIAALRQRVREIRALADPRFDAVPDAEIEGGSHR